MLKLLFTVCLIVVALDMSSQCSDLFFSEYIEGSSNNKALEIYNPTNEAIDLSDYALYRNSNGSLLPSDSLLLEGTLLADEVYVIANPSASESIAIQRDTAHNLLFYNGDDAVWMKKISSGDTLDIIGEIGVDPGAGWNVGGGATNNHTLVRDIAIQQGNTDWIIGTTEWDVFPIDMDDSLGMHSMISCRVVPVDLVNFEGEYLDQNQVKLSWETATELNNNYFTVERRRNDLSWKEVFKVNGNGSSIGSHMYVAFDRNLEEGLNYYRLKQVDFNGSIEYSKQISIAVPVRPKTPIVYPNPASKELFVEFEDVSMQDVTIFTLYGDQIKEKIQFSHKTSSNIHINIEDLPKGSYFIKMGASVQKFLKF